MTDNRDLKLLREIEEGAVIRYKGKGAVYDTYLVVSEVKDGVVHGHMVSHLGVNAISLEALLEKPGLSIAEFKPFKSQ